MLTIWGRKTSSNVQALMWCVGELGLEYHRHDVGHHFGGLDTQAFANLNPNRTIPVLKYGTNPPLWETGAILRYLADRYAPDTFWPKDPVQRAEVDKWAEWAKISVAMGFTVPVFWHVVRTAPADRDRVKIRNAVEQLETKLEISDRRLESREFFTGPDLTLADIQFGHILYRYYDIEISRAQFPNLKRYYTQLTERPAFRQHVMISYEDLRVS